MFEDRTTQQLRDEFIAFNRAENASAEPAVPLPPAAPPGLTAEQQLILADNWAADILTRRSDSWTPAEKNAVRAAINRTLRTL